MLQEEGKLSVDDPVAKYLPELADLKTPDGKPAKLTLRHLLTHTSGIKDYLGDLRRDFPNGAPPETIVRAAMEAPLNFMPGAKWSYSNTG